MSRKNNSSIAFANQHSGARICRFIVSIAVITLSACSSITYKRGASPDTMASDETHCRTGSHSVTEFRHCMRERGWFVAGADDSSIQEVTNAVKKNSAAPPVVLDEAASVPALIGSAESLKPVQTLPMPPAAAPKSYPVESGTAEAQASRSLRNPTAGKTVESFEKNELLKIIAIGSWWKFGGNAAGLDADSEACTKKLGEAHRPNPGATRVTNHMGACLKELGWYGVAK